MARHFHLAALVVELCTPIAFFPSVELAACTPRGVSRSLSRLIRRAKMLSSRRQFPELIPLDGWQCPGGSMAVSVRRQQADLDTAGRPSGSNLPPFSRPPPSPSVLVGKPERIFHLALPRPCRRDGRKRPKFGRGDENWRWGPLNGINNRRGLARRGGGSGGSGRGWLGVAQLCASRRERRPRSCMQIDPRMVAAGAGRHVHVVVSVSPRWLPGEPAQPSAAEAFSIPAPSGVESSASGRRFRVLGVLPCLPACLVAEEEKGRKRKEKKRLLRK